MDKMLNISSVDLSPLKSFNAIIKTNKYINTKTESKSDIHSFCTLSKRKLEQSQNIMLGICMEQLFKDSIKEKSDWEDIRPNKVIKGSKETDHLWKNSRTKQIIYAEQKNNINLDTEKSKSTDDKVYNISINLTKEYPDYKVSSYILAARYLSNKEKIATDKIKKYTKTNILGVNEFLWLFNIVPIKDYNEYSIIINAIVERKFNFPDTCL